MVGMPAAGEMATGLCDGAAIPLMIKLPARASDDDDDAVGAASGESADMVERNMLTCAGVPRGKEFFEVPESAPFAAAWHTN